MIVVIAAIVACLVAFATASAVCKARQGADVARIALLEQRVAELSRLLVHAPTPSTATLSAPSLGPSYFAAAADIPALDSSLESQVRALLGRGRKIEAIKVYRDQTSVGLKEAKDAVEAIEREQLRR